MPRPGLSRNAIAFAAAGIVLLLPGLLFTAACVVSIKWWFGYSTQTWLADIDGGTLYSKHTPADQPRRAPGWYGGANIDHVNGRNWNWTWWAFDERSMPREKLQAHSVWPIGPALTLTGGWLVVLSGRPARRAARNQCPACGYSRAGLAPAASCPECGAANTAAPPSQAKRPA